MSLSDSKVGATIAVADMDRARAFYEGMLGLTPGTMDEAGGVVYECGGGSEVLVYASDHAGTTEATVATWEVDDLEQVVDELAAKGVEFERYGEPLQTDERGIHADQEMGKVAWFRDPDGNTIAVGEFGEGA